MSTQSVTIQVKRNDYPRIADQIRPRVSDAINDGIANFLVIADATVPVDTGHLRAHKAIEASTPATLVGTVTYRANYAAFVHEGTVRQAPQPWAREAVRTIAPSYQAAMAAAIGGIR